MPIADSVAERQWIRLVIPEISVFDGGGNLLSQDANDTLVSFLGNAENAARMFPTIYEAIQKMMARGTVSYSADFSKTAEELMKKGELVLGVGEDGSILPQLRDAKTQRIYEQVRLKVDQVPQDVVPSLADLQLQMTMAQMLAEIKNVAATVEALRLEGQADRIAEAESVWLRLQQTAKVMDARLREMQLVSVVNAATASRSRLQKNLSVRISVLNEGSTKVKARNANEILDELVAITLMSRSEYAAFALLEEPEAAVECLRQLSDFLLAEKLDSRDTLLEINSHAGVKNEEVVNSFHTIVGDVTAAFSEGVEPARLLLNS